MCYIEINIMKMRNYICIIVCLLFTGFNGCSMLHNEAERGIKKDVKEYLQEPEGNNQINGIVISILDSKFDGYAKGYQDRTIGLYKGRISWILGIISVIVAFAGGLGFNIVHKKRKKQNEDT